MTPARIDWSKVQDLATAPPRVIARRLGVPQKRVALARWRRYGAIASEMAPRHIDWLRQPLGLVPDRVIASDLGVTVSAVQTARLRLGIGPVVGTKTAMMITPEIERELAAAFPKDREALGVAIYRALLEWLETRRSAARRARR